MDAQKTENTLVALVAPSPLLKKNLHKMTFDGSENPTNVFPMSRIPKNAYSSPKIGRISKELWPKTGNCPMSPRKTPPKLEELSLSPTK
jgi:hypothetical protein